VSKSKWHKHCLDAVGSLTQFGEDVSLCADHTVVSANGGQDEVVAGPVHHLIDHSSERIQAAAEERYPNRTL
jgi:hypothetical protein